MSIVKTLVDFSKYTDKNRTYYALLEFAIIAWILYTFQVTNLLRAPWIVQHVSNLIGTIVIMLVIIGPASFRSPELHAKRIYITAIVMVAMNLILELFNPIEAINLSVLYWGNFNTPDYIDAIYGAGGVLTVLVSLALLKHHKSKRTQAHQSAVQKTPLN